MFPLDPVCSFCGPGPVDLADLVQLVPGGGSATSETDRAEKQDGEEEADWRKRILPLREGAVWEITGGAQNIMIHVSKRTLTGGVIPCIRASDSSFNCVFPLVSDISDSPATLKDAWIANGEKLTGSGVSFVSFDRSELGEYFRSITPSFCGFTRAGPCLCFHTVPEDAAKLRN
jgi:hypothetical protein